MLKMRWLTIFTIFVLLFPTQTALAARIVRLAPTISVTPFSVTTPVNSTVLYKVNVNNIPSGGIHCAKVDLFVTNGFKIYPGTGYAFYHVYDPASLEFKVKVPANPTRKWIYARVSWSKDYACRSIRITNTSRQVELIVTK